MPFRLTLLAVLCAALAGPASAVAAESFVGVLADGSLVRFQSDSPTGLTSPMRVRGVAPRERLVALGSSAKGVYAIGSSARLYALEPRLARVRPIGQPFPQGLRGTRFSLAISRDGTTGRLLSDVGQSLTVDLATGAAADAPPLRRTSDGGQSFPAADFLADGRLAGIDLLRGERLTETAPGSAQLDVAKLEFSTGWDVAEPIAFDVASDGRHWGLASFGGRRFRPQAILLDLERLQGTRPIPFQPFLRRVLAFASTGTVADDERPPAVGLRLPRRLSLRDLVEGRLRVRVLMSEGGQASVWVRVPGTKPAGPAVSTRDIPGEHRLRYFKLSARERRLFRANVGRKVRVSVRVADWAGNGRRIDRFVRLTR